LEKAKGIQDLPDPALFTDDTQMSVAIAEALVKAGEKDIEPIMVAIKDEFIKWYHSPENNRAPLFKGNGKQQSTADLSCGIRRLFH